MIAKVKIRNWGSSLGVVVPKDIVTKEGIESGDEVIIEIRKKKSVEDVFGTLKEWKIDPQKTKEELRKGWK